MNLSTHIYLFAGLFVAIFCTHIMPTGDKKTESIKRKFIITYRTNSDTKYLDSAIAKLKEEYNNKNNQAEYKAFDEVFEVKIVPISETTDLQGTSLKVLEELNNSMTQDIICDFVGPCPQRSNELQPWLGVPEKYLKIENIITSFLVFTYSGKHTNKCYIEQDPLLKKACVFERLTDGVKLIHLPESITLIKVRRSKEEIKESTKIKTCTAQSTLSWKKIGLITAGIISACILGGYLMMDKRNQKTIMPWLNLSTEKTTSLMPQPTYSQQTTNKLT